MSMADRDGFIWQDGALVPWREATTHVLTHSLHYGLAVFEGIRCYETDEGTAVFRLAEHTRRLFESAKILQMGMPFTEEQIKQATLEVLRANKLKSGYIRPLAFLGPEGMGLLAQGLKTHVIIAAWPWGAYLGEEGLERGIRVKTSSYTRHHVNIAMCRAKASGHYINSVLAKREAVDGGYDEALLLDDTGFVAEGSGENIFVIRDGVIYTPQLTSSLNGITRHTVMTIAHDLGHEVREAPITRDTVYVADEAFFTGTAAEVTPIRELDHRTIGEGRRGPITEKIQTIYFDAVHGRDPRYRHWLTSVAP
ncbi:MAG: branched chain amino acid aminotransferase [Alphaproteobacteria bacterium CG_4_10_14_0_2_um_filter_63_37]|nr:MAG: branched chain amino acid aminotransferase [Proteobacteria bacterium CG1_02_64_396]PJA25931.1 MAG: branched chain amino acid aminotransferase [Alphaproteobacteria bacterium CG_4_10_14_0_2_um_filter_63_37]